MGIYDGILASVEGALASYVGKDFGDFVTRSITVDLGTDSDGEDALFVHVELSDPRDETWELDPVMELHRVIRGAVRYGSGGLPTYVILRPESEGDFEEGNQLLSRA